MGNLTKKKLLSSLTRKLTIPGCRMDRHPAPMSPPTQTTRRATENCGMPSTEGESDVDEVNQVDEESDEEMKNKFSEEMDESLIRKKTLQDFAVSTSQPAVKRIKKTPPVQSIKPSNDPEKEIPSKKKKIEEIDPNAFITLPTVVLQSSIPETEQGNEED